jgi:hypothetical protein
MNLVRESNIEILVAFRSTYPFCLIPDDITDRNFEVFQEELGKRGLCIMPVPERQVHDVDRLVRAEEIIVLQSKIIASSATEVFDNHRSMVNKRNELETKYFNEFVTEIELETVLNENN